VNIQGRTEAKSRPMMCGLLNREIGGLCSFENSADVVRRFSKHRAEVDAVRRQPAGFDVVPEREHCGQTVCDRQFGDPRCLCGKVRTGQHQRHLRAVGCRVSERRNNIVPGLFEL